METLKLAYCVFWARPILPKATGPALNWAKSWEKTMVACWANAILHVSPCTVCLHLQTKYPHIMVQPRWQRHHPQHQPILEVCKKHQRPRLLNWVAQRPSSPRQVLSVPIPLLLAARHKVTWRRVWAGVGSNWTNNTRAVKSRWCRRSRAFTRRRRAWPRLARAKV